MDTLKHWLLWLFLWTVVAGKEQGQFVSPTIWSFNRPDIWFKPYDWTYLRVDLPPWFSSMTMIFTSTADIDKEHAMKIPKSMLPVICFSQGRPPLPDVSDTYSDSLLSNFIANGTAGGAQYLLSLEQCIPFQKNLTFTSTRDKVSPGIWYIGFFNGLGPERTQSKMINRGHSYTLSASINVGGCTSSTIWGPFCNKSIDMTSCSQISNFKRARTLLDVNLLKRSGFDLKDAGGHLGYDSTIKRKRVTLSSNISRAAEVLISCTNSLNSCVSNNDGELKFYSMDIVDLVSQFTITASELTLNQTPISNSSADFQGILVMCYVRYNSMPSGSLYDQSGDISRSPLIVNSPKIGQWYVALQVLHQKKVDVVPQENFSEVSLCFSFEWQLHQCDNGMIGQNCTWELHVLQRVLKRSSVPVEFYYVPNDQYGSLDTNFYLGHLMSNTSVDNVTWTYFFLEVPHGVAGTNLHFKLISENIIHYEIYSRHGGAASMDNWDFYVNSTSNSSGSMIVTSSDLSKGRIEFYLLHVREGIWSFGVQHAGDVDEHDSYMSISLEACPKHCSSNGECRYSVDESGLTFFSYCSCDRNHGSFDCSDELVSSEGHIWHSIFLVASNGAAILPAYWSLRQKAFAEWILFTSSGISSGLYHACDVGSWCALSFHALQFMDFWLSFMAVVSTFVYMATVGEASKRAIHTAVAILTALLAETGATRSENIFIVIAIGTLCLLVGWLLEFSAASRSLWPPRFDFSVHDWLQSLRRRCWNLMKKLIKRFNWILLLVGFIGLALAGTSWTLETNSSYWFWHSFWHISIYTASFFFLCSVRPKINEPQEPQYELARQNSLSRE